MTYAVERASVHVGAATLLDEVTLHLRAGEVVAVAGPNGAGKTTLVRVLAGDLKPGAGEVTLAGRSLPRWPRQELATRRAVMSTERDVAFAYSVEEVALMGRLPLHGGDPDETDRDIVRHLLAAADCAHLARRAYATLSTGERQRVQLARALAQVTRGPAAAVEGTGPRFLLLDEPTSSLDPAHQHVAMRLVRQRADEGDGALAVLHDLNLAAAYADRIVLMRGGRVVSQGAPAEVLEPGVLEAVFDIPMLVLHDPRLSHPLVVAEPPAAGLEVRRGTRS